jgi:hypothetical protein
VSLKEETLETSLALSILRKDPVSTWREGGSVEVRKRAPDQALTLMDLDWHFILHNCEKVNFCVFKLPSLWYFVKVT